MRSLGIDIGGTSVKCALLDGEQIVSTAQSESYARPDASAVRLAVASTVRAVLGAGTDESAPGAIGLCAPGLLDEARRTITLSVNVPGLIGLQLDELVAHALGRAAVRPARIATDAHAAAFDVWSSQRPSGRLLAISLGTGVGACVLDEGVPLVIVGRSPGHFGQMDVTVPETGRAVPVGPDGGRGSLEAYLGAPALRARFGADFAPGLLASGVAEAPLAALVRAVRIGHAMFRPQAITLLGGIGLVLRPRLSDLHAAISDGLTSLARPGWTLTAAEHGFHAAAGVARLAAREVL